MIRLRDGDYLHSFNPTAGRLAACLLGFSIQVQIQTPTELTLTHRGTQPRPPHRVCSAAAARRRRPAGRQGQARPRERRAEGIASIAWAELRKCRAAGCSIDGGSGSVTLAGLHSFLFSKYIWDTICIILAQNKVYYINIGSTLIVFWGS